MTHNLSYCYPSEGINLNQSQMYEGERIICKNENIKYEDSLKNVERGTNVYFTNFRVICCSEKYIFDIPLPFISKHSIYKPFFNHSSYIYLEFKNTSIPLINSCPTYLKENFTDQQLTQTYNLPKNIMIKFKDNKVDLTKPNNLLQMAINAKEYTLSFKKKEPPKPQSMMSSQMNNNYNNNNNSSQMTNQEPEPEKFANETTGHNALGIAHIKQLQRQKMEQQKQMISGSFSDIQSLRQNAKEMIEIAQNIRAKINVSTNANSSSNATSSSEINSVLSKIGFIDPVTKEVAGSEYYIKLAEQIDNYFFDYFSKNKNIKVITLIDAYCIYNRARGGNTVSPKDMQQALKNFNKIQPKILIKNFNNEMIVLHTHEYSNQNILTLIINFMKENKKEFIDDNEMSKILNCNNVLLEKILIDDMLVNGFICLDESDLSVRYFENKIKDFKL